MKRCLKISEFTKTVIRMDLILFGLLMLLYAMFRYGYLWDTEWVCITTMLLLLEALPLGALNVWAFKDCWSMTLYQKSNPQIGWFKIGENWYLSDKDGHVVTGWNYVGNEKFGKWYYFNTDPGDTYGKMLTGWVETNGKYYYLCPKENDLNRYGWLLTNAVTPDGFLVGEDGAAIIGQN